MASIKTNQLNPKDYFNLDEYNFGTFITDETEKEEVRNLVCEYASKITNPTQDDVEVLIEQYTILSARKLPAYEWISAIIGEVSKKDASKQYIGYMIGIIRNRMTNGWGTSRSDEEILILRAVERLIGRDTSLETKSEIYKMMGQHGSTKIAFALHNVNIERLFVEALENELNAMKDL